MISQRLRGVAAEGESLEADFVPKLKKAFADAGVAIEDQNGELRSTFDILQDLAARWDDLDSKQRQYLGEKAAGNRQVKVLNAIMANWDVVQDTIDKANEATGAATEGNEKYLDSIQGRITAFQSAFQNLARTTIDSGLVKGVVNLGTGIVNITTKLGGLVPVASTLLGLVLAFKGAKIGESISKALPAFAQLFTMIHNGQGAVASFFSLFTSSGAGMVGGILAAAGVLAAVISAIKNSMPDLNQKAEDSKQNYVEQQQKVEGLNDKLKETQDLLSSMEGKKLTVLEEGEQKRLENANAELLRQIELEKQRLEISERSAREAAAQAGKKKLNTPTASIVSPDLIEAVGGYKEFTKITGRTADESLDPSGFTRGMSVLQEAEVRMQALQNAKNEFNKAQAKFLETDPSETDALNALEAEKEKWSTIAKESEEWLNNTLSDIQNLTEGISSVEDAVPGSLDEYFNKLLEFQAQLEKAILNSRIADMSKTKQFDMILGKYPEQVKKVEEQIKSMSKEVGADSEDMRSAVEKALGKEMIADFTNMGWEVGEVIDAVIESFTSGEQSTVGFVSVMPELIESNFLATESYKNLSKAMTEQQKAGVITMETYQALISDSGLPGIANYLTLTAEGFALNTEGIYDYIKAQNDELKVKALSELQDKQTALAQLKEELRGLTDEQERMAQGALVEQTQNEINALEAYINSLDSAVGALERYKAAKSTANEDEDYTTGQSAFKDVQEGWKSGKVGTDDYKEAMGFFLGDAYGTTMTGEEAYKAASKLGNRYFKDEKKGVKNFLSDLDKTKLVSKDENGNLSLKEGTTLKQVAESLSEVTGNAEMSEDAVAALFELLNTYSESNKFEFPEFITPKEQEEIEKRKQKIEELGKTETDVKGRIAELDNKIAEAEDKNQDTSQLEKRREALQKTLETVSGEKSDLEEGASVDVDTMSLEEAKQKIDELYTTIQTLEGEGLDIPVALSGEYEAAIQNIEKRLSNLENDPTEAEVKADDQTEEGVTSAQGHLDGIEEPEPKEITAEDDTKTATQEAKDNLDSVKQANPADISADSQKAEQAAIGAQNEIEKVEDKDVDITAEYSATTDGSESIVEKLLDDIALKPRTATITVETVPEGQNPNDYDPIQEYARRNGLNADGYRVKNHTGKTAQEALDKEIKAAQNSINSALGSGNGRDFIGQAMMRMFGTGFTDLLNRPVISSSKLTKAGWGDAGDGNATVFSSGYNIGENGEVGVLMTPILPDGQVLSPNSLDRYVDNLKLDENGGVDPKSDPLGLVAYQENLKDMPEDVRNSYMDSMGDFLHQFQEAYYEGIDPLDIKVQPEENAGEQLVNDTQGQVDAEPPLTVSEEPVVEPAPSQPNIPDLPAPADDQTVNLHFQADGDASEVIEEVQEAADAEPIEITFTADDVDNLGSLVGEKAEVGDYFGYTDEVNKLKEAYSQLQQAQSNLSNTDPGDTSAYSSASSDLMSAASNFNSAYSDLSAALAGIPDVTVDADTSNAMSKVSQLDAAASKGVTKTITIQTQGSIPPFAKGTRNASTGPALVDDGNGPELIEHVSKGTYELGTNKGPRFTYLDKGDVVHTAEETKRIMSRMSKIGGFFRDGLNKGKSIIGNAFARGISGSISLSSINRVLQSTRTSNSNAKRTNSSSARKLNNKKFQEWAEKLFDWAEIRLQHLRTITNSWLLSASEAIGYIARNHELTSAIASVEDQIEATTQAYDLYMKQTDIVQRRAGFSDAVAEKIRTGNIEIASYSKETQEKIKQYQEWYEKALACADALNDLREQEKELAKQKLDNIIQHYTNRIDRLDNQVRLRESQIELATAQGTEIQASMYNTSIEATSQKLEELVAQRDALNAEMTQLMSQGLIEKESDTWHEYTGKIEDVENAIVETRTAIIELHDTANEVNLTKLGYQLDALTNSAYRMSDMMNLHTAQGIDEVAEAYQELIENGMEQIANLERQNEELREQQNGLDVLSEKYQDLESQIQSNIASINDMKVSQEGWNDSVLDLKISQLEEYRDKLNKTNEQYERQKKLREAIEELEKAQSQRTQKVYREGKLYAPLYGNIY